MPLTLLIPLRFYAMQFNGLQPHFSELCQHSHREAGLPARAAKRRRIDHPLLQQAAGAVNFGRCCVGFSEGKIRFSDRVASVSGAPGVQCLITCSG